MKKRIGTKVYDTDTAILVETTPDGIQVYRKKNSPQFFLYNPNGKNKHEMFFELPAEETAKYIGVSDDQSKRVKDSNAMIRFSPHDQDRIRKHASALGMSMSKFLLMLVDEYEKQQK